MSGRSVHTEPEEILRFGGEFFLRFGRCRARDHFGIIPGDCPKGTFICGNEVQGAIEPVGTGHAA